MGQDLFEVAFSPKPIHCILMNTADGPVGDTVSIQPQPRLLIFTHGAGGTIKADAVANFCSGYALERSILCFQGSMNLNSRTKMFRAVIEAQKAPECLGGRSMGARAAAMAVTDLTSHLVLVSYPLHTNKAIRDQILLDLAPSIKVIFVSGDKDSMCDLQKLEELRSKMKCRTWRIVVENADHGMNVKPKVATAEVVRKTGEVVAAWTQDNDESRREGTIFLNPNMGAEWSGWTSKSLSPVAESSQSTLSNTAEKPLKQKRTRSSPDPGQNLNSTHESIAKRTRSRKQLPR